jgi:hypothetical protein
MTKCTKRCVEVGIEIDVGVCRPQPLTKIFPRHQVPSPFQKKGQHFERLLVQLDFQALTAKLTFEKIDLKCEPLIPYALPKSQLAICTRDRSLR